LPRWSLPLDVLGIVFRGTSSTCAGAADLRVLGPGDGYTEQVKWQREQSVTGCPANPPSVTAGTYAIAASVGGVASATVQFQLQ